MALNLPLFRVMRHCKFSHCAQTVPRWICHDLCPGHLSYVTSSPLKRPAATCVRVRGISSRGHCWSGEHGQSTSMLFAFNKQGGTHSHTLLRLVVDLFLRLQIAIRTRHISGCLNMIADRISRPNQPTTEWSLHPEKVNRISGHGELQQKTCLPQSPTCIFPSLCLHSGASSTGSRCSVKRFAREVDIHVSTVSPAQQSHSETKDHPGGRFDTNSPLVAVTPSFPHLLRLCVDHVPLIIPYRRDLLSQ